MVNLAADVQAAQLLALELFTGSGRGEAEAPSGICVCPGVLDRALYEAACLTRCGPGGIHWIVIPKLAFTFSVPPRDSSGMFSAVWP